MLSTMSLRDIFSEISYGIKDSVAMEETNGKEISTFKNKKIKTRLEEDPSGRRKDRCKENCICFK